MFYSAQTGGFYSKAVHGNSIPADAIEITQEYYEDLLRGQSNGKKIASGENGQPISKDPDPVPVSVLLAAVKTELRAMRAPMLDALAGIAGRATRAGNDALAAEADVLAVSLLEITDDADLNASATYEAMQAAGVAAYKRIAGTASTDLAIVFREITGA